MGILSRGWMVSVMVVMFRKFFMVVSMKGFSWMELRLVLVMDVNRMVGERLR